MKKTKINKMYLLSAVLFIAAAVWFVVSVNNADSAGNEKQTEAVYRTIMNGAALCYSIEGEYPPSLEYLEDNYGVRVDKSKYAIDYSYFGANIRPTVTVAEKGASQ